MKWDTFALIGVVDSYFLELALVEFWRARCDDGVVGSVVVVDLELWQPLEGKSGPIDWME
jgi:hypothetical protein